MELQKTWFEKLDAMELEECMPLKATPKASIYSAIHFNRGKLDGRKYRVQKDKKTGKDFVCRVK